QFQLPINTLGRLTDPTQFADIILKAGPGAAPSASPAAQAMPGSKGQVQGPGTPPMLSAQGGPASAPATGKPAPAATRRTRPPDVGQIELGAQQYAQVCPLDARPSVALTIYQLPGSNALQTAEGVYAKMEELKKRFPVGLDYRIVYDTTPFIRESVAEVFHTLRDAVILVAIVVLLFLQDWRAMILPMI